MRRRNFLRNVTMAGSGAFMFNNVPLRALPANSQLQQALMSSEEDKVIVLVQLHGGNDGLNCFVPLNQYSEYYNLRPNIALKNGGNRGTVILDTTLPEEQMVGIHPDLLLFKEMYENDQAALIQNVAYDNINGSHFRSRDIWFMGGDYNESFGSGWIGRYLDQKYPGYPEQYPNDAMPDPLALEIGSNVSLAFHRETSIPTAISLSNPDQFYNLVKTVGIDPPESVADTYYGNELQWIMDIEEKANQYAGQLKKIYDKGKNSSVHYPEIYPYQGANGISRNGLSPQLKMIARLLQGGSKTRVFLAKIGGFDTHADQVLAGDTSMGLHASLMYHLVSAINAFHKDLNALGLGNKVTTVTFSEFGRRAASNVSYGTDHGKAAPMMMFGNGVKSGVYGNNPDLNNLAGKNLRHEIDYRQVFTALLQDWMGATDQEIINTNFGDYRDTRLPIIDPNKSITANNNYQKLSLNIFPNPTSEFFHIQTSGLHQGGIITVSSIEGRKIFRGHLKQGQSIFQINCKEWPAGSYIVNFNSAGKEWNTKLLITN